MTVYRELGKDEASDPTSDFFVKGMRPSPSVKKILRPVGEWDKTDDKTHLLVRIAMLEKRIREFS